MTGALNSGISGLQSFQQKLDVIGNNIANVNTSGYKAARVEFADALSQSLQTNPNGGALQVGSGVGTSSIRNVFTAGTYTQTGTNTDLAVYGEGFFTVRNAQTDAKYATRAGQFQAKNGYLVDQNGNRVQGYTDSSMSTIGDVKIDASSQIATLQAQASANYSTALTRKNAADTAAAPALQTKTAAEAAMKAAETALNASPADAGLQTAYAQKKKEYDDEVVAAKSFEDDQAASVRDLNAAKGRSDIADALSIQSFEFTNEGVLKISLSDNSSFNGGQVLLQNFRNPQALKKEGNNLYSGMDAAEPLATLARPNTAGVGSLKSGELEMSNVDLTNEFSDIITTQRAFQASARIVTTSDEMLQEIVNLKR